MSTGFGPPPYKVAYRWGVSQLKLASVKEPTSQAYYLLPAESSGHRASLPAETERMPLSEWLCFVRRIVRRARGEPVQYIKGWTEFYSLPLRVSPDVLIPRPETEILVEGLLARLDDLPIGPICDIGTGSGAVVISLAHHLQGRRFAATDISRKALQVAKKNAASLDVQDRIDWLCGSLFAPVGDMRFAAVVSNPPYIRSDQVSTLSKEVRQNEPRIALDGGEDGLQLIREIVCRAPKHLKLGGLLALEVGHGQAAATKNLCRKHFGSSAKITTDKDLAGIERVVFCEHE